MPAKTRQEEAAKGGANSTQTNKINDIALFWSVGVHAAKAWQFRAIAETAATKTYLPVRVRPQAKGNGPIERAAGPLRSNAAGWPANGLTCKGRS